MSRDLNSPAPARTIVTPSALATRWRRFLSATFYLVLASGIVWLAARYLFVTQTEFGQELPAWAAKVLAVHGASAMFLLLALGAWLPVHVAPRWRQSLQRTTGWSQLAMLLLLILTGLGLYYAAGETSRPVISMTHWIIGVLLLPVFLVHRRGAPARPRNP